MAGAEEDDGYMGDLSQFIPPEASQSSSKKNNKSANAGKKERKVGKMKNAVRKKQRTNIRKRYCRKYFNSLKRANEEQTSSKDRGEEIYSDVYTQEILSYLPASNLQTLKTVCKDWFQLITSPYFVKLHLSRSNRSRIRILVSLPNDIIEHNYNGRTELIPYPPHVNGWETKILGSVDGLICMVDEAEKETRPPLYILFNPSTKNFFTTKLRSSSHSHTYFNILCFWFGKHPSFVEYILVMGTCSPGHRYEFGTFKFTRSVLQHIHSVSIDMQIEYPCHFLCFCVGMIMNGAVYWAVKRYVNERARYTIMAYRPDENKFWEMLPPAQSEFSLGVVDGCLFAIQKNDSGVFEIWVMKECWTKCGDIEGFNNSRLLSPLGYFPNGDLILDVDRSELIKYSFEDKEDTYLMPYGSDGYPVIMCADTLVSPTS